MKKLLMILALLIASFFALAQDTPPVGPDFKALQSVAWKFDTRDTTIWMYKGVTYGWTQLATQKHLLFKIDSLGKYVQTMINTREPKNPNIQQHIINDADTIIGNEYNTSMSWNNASNTISVLDGGGTKSAIITGFLESEIDGSISNEGTLGVSAGSASSSVITSNTSGATGVTINAGTGLGITEVASTNGGSITLNHSNSITAGTTTPSSNQTPSLGDAFDIPKVSYDAQGHITSTGTQTVTMPTIGSGTTGYFTIWQDGPNSILEDAPFTTFLQNGGYYYPQKGILMSPPSDGDYTTAIQIQNSNPSTAFSSAIVLYKTNNGDSVSANYVLGRIGFVGDGGAGGSKDGLGAEIVATATDTWSDFSENRPTKLEIKINKLGNSNSNPATMLEVNRSGIKAFGNEIYFPDLDLGGVSDNKKIAYNLSTGKITYKDDINISLTTSNNSGAATYSALTGVLNIPIYTLAGLGGQTALNGTGFVKASGTSISYDNNSYYYSGNSNLTSVNWSSDINNSLQYNLNGTNINTVGTLTNVAYKGVLITNYAVKYDGTQLVNSQIFDNGTNVGIGTASPSQKLDVNGKIALGGIAVLYRPTFVSGTLVVGNGGGNLGTGANYNTFVGVNSGNSNTTGNSNTANGYSSLFLNTTGSNNTAIGHSSLYANTTGSSNTAIGQYSLYANTTGYYNTANGMFSLYSNTTGHYNTAIGLYSLRANTTGGSNTAIGTLSGTFTSSSTSNSSGSNSVFIGYDTRPMSNGETNQIVIGHNAIGHGSNTARIGNSSLTEVFTSGVINAPTAKFTNLTDGYLPIHNSDITGLIDANIYQSGNILTYATAPTFDSDRQIVDKAYVDAIASGNMPKLPVDAATTNNITLSGTQTIDGYSVTAGMRILVKNQSTTSQNGVYIVAAGAWSRSTDLDTWDELYKAYVAVLNGTQSGSSYVCNIASTGTLNTDPISWVLYNAPTNITVSSPLAKSGNNISLNYDSNTLAVTSNALKVKDNVFQPKSNILTNTTATYLDADSTKLAGLITNSVPDTRTLTINGTTQDLSADRTYNVGTVTSVGTGLGLIGGTITITGTISVDTADISILSRQRAANTYQPKGDYSQIYPPAGIPLSTGSAWGTSITNNSSNWNTAYSWGNHATAGYLTSYTETDPIYTASSWYSTTNNSSNWNTAYTDRNKWDGGATGLVAATGRTSLGGTTIGQSVFTSTNPSAIRFLRANANNTATWLTASDFRTAIGAGTGSGSVTSVATGLGLTGGTITGSGTISLDTSNVNVLSRQRAANTYQVKGNYLTSYTETDPIYSASSWFSTTNNSTNWNTAYTNRINSLTTTGSSGAATLISNVLNIPIYTITGLGGQPQLNGTGFVKASGTSISYDNNSYYYSGNSNNTSVNWSSDINNSLQYNLNGTNINTAGTLSNVAYKAQDNNFTVSQTINGDIDVIGKATAGVDASAPEDLVRFGQLTNSSIDLNINSLEIKGEAIYPRITGTSVTGSIDGVNATFACDQLFITNSTEVYVNGVRQQLGYHYIESGQNIIFQDGFIPGVGERIKVDYLK